MENVVDIIIKKEVKMPGRDQTGPEGKGSMTGRKMGTCAGNDGSFQKENFWGGRRFFDNRGRGFRNSFRRGRGFRNFYEGSVEDETSIKDEIKLLKEHLAELEAKLKNS